MKPRVCKRKLSCKRKLPKKLHKCRKNYIRVHVPDPPVPIVRVNVPVPQVTVNPPFQIGAYVEQLRGFTGRNVEVITAGNAVGGAIQQNRIGTLQEVAPGYLVISLADGPNIGRPVIFNIYEVIAVIPDSTTPVDAYSSFAMVGSSV